MLDERSTNTLHLGHTHNTQQLCNNMKNNREIKLPVYSYSEKRIKFGMNMCMFTEKLKASQANVLMLHYQLFSKENCTFFGYVADSYKILM